MGLVGELRKRGYPAVVGRAVVLGRREDIADALAEGFSMRQV
jgi:hypothetical protein